MHDILIVGAGGHGKVALGVVLAAGQFRPVGFVDADPGLTDAYVAGLPVLGSISALPRLREGGLRHAIVAIADHRARLRCMAVLREQGFELSSAVHPSACVSPSARLGGGVLVGTQASVACDARIGDGAVLGTSAVVGPECDVGEAAHVGPRAVLAGRVRVGAGAVVGIGSQVIQCRTVGPYAVVGAGAAVIHDVPDGATVVGVPARVVKTRQVEPDLAGAAAL